MFISIPNISRLALARMISRRLFPTYKRSCAHHYWFITHVFAAFTCGPPKGWREDGGVKVKVAFASAVVVIVVEILENATVPLIWPTFFSSLEGVRAALVIVFHTWFPGEYVLCTDRKKIWFDIIISSTVPPFFQAFLVYSNDGGCWAPEYGHLHILRENTNSFIFFFITQTSDHAMAEWVDTSTYKESVMGKKLTV